MASLKSLPVLYLVEDNGWDISATAEETRSSNAYTYAKGFAGLEAISLMEVILSNHMKFYQRL